MRSIPEKALKAVQELINKLSEKIDIQEVYLFGSYAKGAWLKTSDIDLIIVSPNFENTSPLKRLDMINEIQWKAGIQPFIEAIPLTPRELKEKIEKSTLLRDASKHWIKIDVEKTKDKQQLKSRNPSPAK